MKRTKMSKLRNGSKLDSNPGSLDCESGILPLSYRAPIIIVFAMLRLFMVTAACVAFCFALLGFVLSIQNDLLDTFLEFV